MKADLALDHQLCFALYAASRVAQGAYRERLDALDLTYPQWLVLLALWEQDGRSVTDLGEHLMLDSGTLSPLLRRMQDRGVLERRRDSADGRRVSVHLTEEGHRLRDQADEIQQCLGRAAPLTPEEVTTLRDLARKLVASARPVE